MHAQVDTCIKRGLLHWRSHEKGWVLWFQRVKERFVLPTFRSEYSVLLHLCPEEGQSTLTETSARLICLSHPGNREPNLSHGYMQSICAYGLFTEVAPSQCWCGPNWHVHCSRCNDAETQGERWSWYLHLCDSDEDQTDLYGPEPGM